MTLVARLMDSHRTGWKKKGEDLVFGDGGAQIRLRLLSFFFLLLFLAIWEAAVLYGLLPSSLVPLPSSVFETLRREWSSGIFLKAVFSSLDHWALGTGAGTLLGVAMGVMVGLWPTFEAAQEGVSRLLRPISPIAWTPFAIIWFGVSRGAAAFIIAIGVFWINYFATLAAVAAVGPDMKELAQAYGQGGFWERLVKIILPCASPGILSGIRSSIGMSWIVVLVAELFGVPGIGQRMMEASGFLATDVVLLYMLTISALYSICDILVVAITRRLLRWMP